MKSLTLKALMALFVCSTFFLSCSNSPSKEKKTSDASIAGDWTILFNGEDLKGWYTYQKQPESTSEVAGLGPG